MDLRKEVHDMIEQNGHYILLQRASKKIRCTCWQEKEQEADPNCPICLGAGRISRIERHKVRRDTASATAQLPNALQQTPIGHVASGTKVFFMKFDTQPKKGDIIMEVGWKGHLPTHLITAYEINYAEDLRGDHGRVEFYQVWTKEYVFDTSIKEITVRRMGPIQNYELVRRG